MAEGGNVSASSVSVLFIIPGLQKSPLKLEKALSQELQVLAVETHECLRRQHGGKQEQIYQESSVIFFKNLNTHAELTLLLYMYTSHTQTHTRTHTHTYGMLIAGFF